MVNCAKFLLNSGVCSIIAIQLLNVLSQSGFRLCSHCTGQVFAPFQKLLRHSVNRN